MPNPTRKNILSGIDSLEELFVQFLILLLVKLLFEVVYKTISNNNSKIIIQASDKIWRYAPQEKLQNHSKKY